MSSYDIIENSNKVCGVGTVDLLQVHATDLVGLVIENNKVSVTDIEAGEMLTGILGIKDVLIDDKCSTSSVGSTATVGGGGEREADSAQMRDGSSLVTQSEYQHD